MMNRIKFGFKVCLPLIIMGLSVSCETEGPDDYKKHFIKYYGGDGNQEAKDFVVNADGTTIMLGTFIETNEDTRLYVVKADVEGNIIWSKKLGSTNESAQDIELITNGTDAGNLVLLSNIKKNEADSTAIRLTIINQAGDSIKSRLFNTLRSQRAKSVTPLTDGGYFVVGNTTDTDGALNTDINPDFEDELTIRYENNWNNSTFYRIGRSSIGSGVKIFQAGTDFYYAGYWNAIELPGGQKESNFFFRKFIDNPNLVPTLYIGNKDKEEFLVSIAQGASGNYMAVGTDISSLSRSLVAARVGSNFQTAGSMVTVSPNAEGVAVTSSGSGDFLILGNEIGTGSLRNISLIKVNDNAQPVFRVTFGASNNDDTGSAVLELPNGDILILGTMQLVNQKKMALIKVKANGSF